MSENNEKDYLDASERSSFLERPNDSYKTANLKEKLSEKCPLHQSIVTVDRLGPVRPESTDSPENSGCSSNVTTSSSTVVVEENLEDDDPPPYTAMPAPNHVGWSYDLPSGIPYSVEIGRAPCSAELGLAAFQASLSPTGIRLDSVDPIGQGTSIYSPLTSYRVDGTRFIYRHIPFSEYETPDKNRPKKLCRYRGILAAAAVIVFLMTLSLLVRFIVENSFWRR